MKKTKMQLEQFRPKFGTLLSNDKIRVNFVDNSFAKSLLKYYVKP